MAHRRYHKERKVEKEICIRQRHLSFDKKDTARRPMGPLRWDHADFLAKHLIATS